MEIEWSAAKKKNSKFVKNLYSHSHREKKKNKNIQRKT